MLLLLHFTTCVLIFSAGAGAVANVVGGIYHRKANPCTMTSTSAVSNDLIQF